MFFGMGLKYGRGFIALLCLTLALAGCKPTATTQIKVAEKEKSDQQQKAAEQLPLAHAADFARESLQALGKGEAKPDAFTDAFKKKIARPRPGDEKDKELGYDPQRVNDYIKKMSSGKYEAPLAQYETTTGPFFFGLVRDNGYTEGYVLRLAKADDKAIWKVDLFYRSPYVPFYRVTIQFGADAVGPGKVGYAVGQDLVSARLAACCFIENVLGGDLQLAEPMLAPKWKRDHYWSAAPSNKERGYDPALVLRELGEWRKGDFSDYRIVLHDMVSDKPFHIEIVAQVPKINAQLQKTFKLTVNTDANGEWLVDDVEVK